MLSDTIQNYLDRYVGGDPSRFDELWLLVPDFVECIKNAIKDQNSWVYLHPETFDGWYLVKAKDGYDLYYQERGANCWGTTSFPDERSGLKALLENSTNLFRR